MEQLIEAVTARLKVYANEQYNNGWDVIVECWDRADFVPYITEVITVDNMTNEDAVYEAAKANVQDFVDLYEEQESNTRFE